MKYYVRRDAGKVTGLYSWPIPNISEEEQERLDENHPEIQEYMNPTEDWLEIRNRRNHLLRQCDWTQLPDMPLTAKEKETWASYRQALRDIPQKYMKIADVMWPDPPIKPE